MQQSTKKSLENVGWLRACATKEMLVHDNMEEDHARLPNPVRIECSSTTARGSERSEKIDSLAVCDPVRGEMLRVGTVNA